MTGIRWIIRMHNGPEIPSRDPTSNRKINYQSSFTHVGPYPLSFQHSHKESRGIDARSLPAIFPKASEKIIGHFRNDLTRSAQILLREWEFFDVFRVMFKKAGILAFRGLECGMIIETRAIKVNAPTSK